MFDQLPSRYELAVFALMAVACAAVVSLVPSHDYAMMFAAMPVFLVAAIMGLRRSEQLKFRKAEVVDPDDELIS